MKRQKENLSLPDKSNAILAEVNRKYSSLIENLQGIVFRGQNDRAYTMEFISEGCRSITGHTPQAFLKGEVNLGEIIEPDDREMVWNDVQKAIAEKRSFELVYRILDTMGNIKHLHESGRPVFDKNGDFEALEGFITDITAQKNTEEELEKSKEQLEHYAQQLEERVKERTKEVRNTVQKLVETNLSLEDQVQTTKAAEKSALESQTLIANVAKNFPKGVILVFNTNMELVLIDGEELNKSRLAKSDFEGKSIDAFPIFTKKRKDKMKKNVQKTLDGQHLSFETKYEENIYAGNSIPLVVDKKITWALFVYDNISEQKRAELNMKEALKKEQELNELKSRFISMASHEFRTPLTAILSSATLIGRLNQAGNEEKRMKYVKQIESNVESLVIILNDFLSLSKLEEGKISFQPEPFDLVQLTKLVVDEIETSKKDGQKITLQNDRPNIHVTLDSKLMRHILVNLISNAIKYSAENTKLDIAITSQSNKALIQVSDQGIGIPPEEHDNLFERFFRAKNTTNIQGTGLGLHIVKQYTELMGGTVSFKSEVGKGTTFFVEFEAP